MPVAGQLAPRRAAALLNSDHFTDDLQVLCGDLSAAIDKVEFELLTFRQAFETSALDCADVHEHILAATFLLDEAEAFLAIEELYRTLAGTDDLCGHAAETAAASAAARATTTRAALSPYLSFSGHATAKAIATTIVAIITGRRKSFHPTTKRIETVLAESVALVPAAPTSPIVTHNPVRTLSHCPSSNASIPETVIRTARERHFDSSNAAL